MKPSWHWSNKSGSERQEIIKKIFKGWGRKPKSGEWVVCPVCGTKKYRKQSSIKRSKELFCSIACFNTSKKGKIPENIEIARAKSPFQKGEKNLNWNGGITPYPAEWTGSLHYKVWQRDKNKCQICGKLGKERSDLIVHHKDFTKKNCKIENLQLLCRSCHLRLHWQHRKSINLQGG